MGVFSCDFNNYRLAACKGYICSSNITYARPWGVFIMVGSRVSISVFRRISDMIFGMVCFQFLNLCRCLDNLILIIIYGLFWAELEHTWFRLIGSNIGQVWLE